jgi:cytochrome c553
VRGRVAAPLAAAALLALAGAATVASAQEQAAPAAGGDPRAGRRLAGARCAACHGNDGIAVLPEAPNLAGQNAAYSAAQLRQYRSGERRHELMTVVSQELTDAQIADLAAWYAAIEVTATVPGR